MNGYFDNGRWIEPSQAIPDLIEQHTRPANVTPHNDQDMVVVHRHSLTHRQEHMIAQADIIHYYRTMSLWSRLKYFLMPGSMVR